MTANVQRAFVLSLLVLLMLGTRINHFAPIPDASWAVFFIGGFHLRNWTRWAFPLLMVLAVAIDWAVISNQGMNFWGHYCVSSGYWALVPAYFAMMFAVPVIVAVCGMDESYRQSVFKGLVWASVLGSAWALVSAMATDLVRASVSRWARALALAFRSARASVPGSASPWAMVSVPGR